MELTAIDGQGGHDITLDAAAIHIAAILVRLGAALRPEASAHKTAAAGINAINGGRLVAKVAAVDDDDRTRLARVNLRDVLGHGVVTMERHQTVFGNGIRAVEHHGLILVPIRNVFVGRMRFGHRAVGIFAVADAVHTARSRTEDATEDAVALRVVFWQNLKRAAIDGDAAKPIERIVDLYVARMFTPRTATIKLRHDDAAVDVIIGVVWRFFGHEIDVGAAHESVARHIVERPLIGQGQFGLRSQRAVDHACHLSALDDDVDVGIHGTLMAACKHHAGIVVVGALNDGIVAKRNHSALIIAIVPRAVDVDVDGTLQWLLRRAHHAVQFGRLGHAVVVCRLDGLSASRTDTGIEARLDGDVKALSAMRHRLVVGRDAVGVVELAIDDFVKVADTFGSNKGEVLKTGVAPDGQSLRGTSDFNLSQKILFPHTGDGGVAEELGSALLCLGEVVGRQEIFALIVLGEVETSQSGSGWARSHQHDGILVPRARGREFFVGPFPGQHGLFGGIAPFVPRWIIVGIGRLVGVIEIVLALRIFLAVGRSDANGTEIHHHCGAHRLFEEDGRAALDRDFTIKLMALRGIVGARQFVLRGRHIRQPLRAVKPFVGDVQPQVFVADLPFDIVVHLDHVGSFARCHRGLQPDGLHQEGAGALVAVGGIDILVVGLAGKDEGVALVGIHFSSGRTSG